MHDLWLRKRAIINTLSKAGFVSGEVLAKNLNISRAAVSKHVAGLEALGVDIYCVKGKGYKLATPISLIDKARLTEALDCAIFYFDQIPSTNGFLLEHSSDLTSGDICVAEHQLAGRGRRGKSWMCAYGGHLYCSFFWRLSQGITQTMGLSLVIACSLITVLRQFGVDNLGVKWPNDIYLNGNKLAGILVEMNGQADCECNLVIGIGVNLAMSTVTAETIDQPWSDLLSLGQKVDKTALMIALQQQLVKDLSIFQRQGFKAFHQRWKQADLFDGQRISLLLQDESVKGTCCGVDEQGAILLKNERGIRAYLGGEISMRPE